MQLVLDANVLFAALMKDSTTRALILSGRLALISPEFIIDEFNKHLDELSDKTSVSKEELTELVEELITVSEIVIVPREEFTDLLGKARQLSPDPDDVPYFALALKHNCPLWSNDSKLKEQESVKVLNTRDLLEFLK